MQDIFHLYHDAIKIPVEFTYQFPENLKKIVQASLGCDYLLIAQLPFVILKTKNCTVYFRYTSKLLKYDSSDHYGEIRFESLMMKNYLNEEVELETFRCRQIKGDMLYLPGLDFDPNTDFRLRTLEHGFGTVSWFSGHVFQLPKKVHRQYNMIVAHSYGSCNVQFFECELLVLINPTSEIWSQNLQTNAKMVVLCWARNEKKVNLMKSELYLEPYEFFTQKILIMKHVFEDNHKAVHIFSKIEGIIKEAWILYSKIFLDLNEDLDRRDVLYSPELFIAEGRHGVSGNLKLSKLKVCGMSFNLRIICLDFDILKIDNNEFLNMKTYINGVVVADAIFDQSSLIFDDIHFPENTDLLKKGLINCRSIIQNEEVVTWSERIIPDLIKSQINIRSVSQELTFNLESLRQDHNANVSRLNLQPQEILNLRFDDLHILSELVNVAGLLLFERM
jgi:hypothetical protein